MGRTAQIFDNLIEMVLPALIAMGKKEEAAR